MIHPPRHPEARGRHRRFYRAIHSPLPIMSTTGKCRTHHHARTHANAPMAGVEVGSDGTKLGSSHDVFRLNIIGGGVWRWRRRAALLLPLR